MKPIPEMMFRKICYILHRAFVQSRMLAGANRNEQAHDLADAFEVVPGCLPNWNDESLALVRSYIEPYQTKYGPSTFDYLAILDMDDASFMEMFANY